jgi:hypothetical protein
MMRKHGSIICKWHLCLPKGPTNSARMRTIVTAAAAVFANGTYFVDIPRTTLTIFGLYPSCAILKNITFWKLLCFHPQVRRWEDTYPVGPIIKRNLSPLIFFLTSCSLE